MDSERVEDVLSTIDAVDDFVDKKINRLEKKHGKKGTIFIIVLIVFILVLSGWFWRSAISNGAKALYRNFEYMKNKSEEESYDKYFEEAKEKAIKDFQSTNELFVTISNIKETADLQVYSVIERVVITQTEDEEKNDKINYWIMYEGRGIYSVNMQISEFIIDQDNHYVLARIPRPELNIERVGEDKILINTDKHFANFINNGSDKRGSEISRNARDRGMDKIQQNIENNLDYYQKAEHFAKEQVERLIRLFNPSIDDLEVEVLFLDE